MEKNRDVCRASLRVIASGYHSDTNEVLGSGGKSLILIHSRISDTAEPVRPSGVKPVVRGILKQKIKQMKKKTGVRTSGEVLRRGPWNSRSRNPSSHQGRLQHKKRAKNAKGQARPESNSGRPREASGRGARTHRPPAGFPAVTRSERELEHAWTYAQAIIEAAPRCWFSTDLCGCRRPTSRSANAFGYPSARR